MVQDSAASSYDFAKTQILLFLPRSAALLRCAAALLRCAATSEKQEQYTKSAAAPRHRMPWCSNGFFLSFFSLFCRQEKPQKIKKRGDFFLHVLPLHRPFIFPALKKREKEKGIGLGCSHFARRYSGNRFCFLFLRLLRCFSSPGCLLPNYELYR